MIDCRLTTSPIQHVVVDGFNIAVKRDDLLNPYFSGNKARKFANILDIKYPTVSALVGYGSIQANSLYSLAALAQHKNWQFNYYVDHIPKWVLQNPKGNYQAALSLSANIIEVSTGEQNLDDYMHEFAKSLPESTMFMPEGGRSHLAEIGIQQLGKELGEYCQSHNISQCEVMLPSGTGTTALFLQKYFIEQQLNIHVLTVPCVGNKAYLEKQFHQLCPNQALWPSILPTPKKYHFGKLYPEFYQTWLSVCQQTNITFELLYDPLGWKTLLEYMKFSHSTLPVIYIHQGGIKGNDTMLPRYQRKYQKPEN